MIILLALGLALAQLLWCVVSLEVNVRKARALGVHVVRIPFNPNNYLWVIAQPLVWKVLACVPISWSSYPNIVRFSHRNWHFLEKSSTAARFGDVWALVSPGAVHLLRKRMWALFGKSKERALNSSEFCPQKEYYIFWDASPSLAVCHVNSLSSVSDPDAIHDICSRWRDFFRPIQMYKMLSSFGPSVFTAEKDEWPRHRRAVALPFNESIMEFVWDESHRQTYGLMNYWASKSEEGIPDMQEDMKTTTFNVLTATAFPFPESYRFRGSTDTEDLTSSKSYRNSLFVVQKHAIHLMLVPYHFFTGPIMPKSLRKIGNSAVSLKNQMVEMVKVESMALSQGEPGSGGLITYLVRSLDRKTAQHNWTGHHTKTAGRGGLSEDEILGNIFVSSFAGYETTARVLAFAMMLLAAHPEVQEWLSEEITTVTQGKPVEESGYELFPRMSRCQAVFLETLRVYAPITALPKVSSTKMESFKAGGQLFTIPPGTEIFPMILGVQTDPRWWDEPYLWRPSRWILQSKGVNGTRKEDIFIPRKGSFLPWAAGPQGCPGKKFSQVEATAILAGLFQSHRVRPKREPGETEEHARKRAQDCADDNNYHLMLQMNHGERVKLQYVKA